MEYETFIDRVRNRGELSDREAAEETVAAVLGTLGERLPTSQRTDLMAQLVDPLKDLIDRAPRTDRRDTDRYPLEEFYQRVAARSDRSRTEAEELSSVVVSVLGEAVSKGEMEDLAEELGVDYRPLFE